MTFCINVLVTPKRGDLYDAVAVNKAPIIIKCKDEERLISILRDDETIQKLLHNLMRNDAVKKGAKFCFRSIENPDSIRYIECIFR